MFEVIYRCADGNATELVSTPEAVDQSIRENRPYLQAGDSISVYTVLKGKVERTYFERIGA